MRICFALLILLLSVPAWADAQPAQPILLWGFQKGCNPLPEATREVQQWLETTVTKPDARAYVLSPDSKLLGCQGASCAELVKRACPNAKGQVMGGWVDQNTSTTHPLLRVRLWMHNLETGKTTYHDNFCHNCTTRGILKVNASEIAQSSAIIAAPGSTPSYCQPEEPMRDLPPRNNKIFWVAYGKEPHKDAIRTAVRKVVQLGGTEVPFEHEGKEYTLPVLRKVIAKEPGAQVLGVEIQSNGKLEVFLYDGPTELIEIQKVECDGCDRDTLVEQVRQTTLSVLSHCFGESCARVGRSRPPAEACRPFEVPRCDGREPFPLVSAGSESGAGASLPPLERNGPEISPRLARLTKGVVWGTFAVTAATSVALFIANATSAGSVQSGNARADNLYLLPASVMAGVSGVLLGIAIPTTIIIDRDSMHAPPTSLEFGRSSSNLGAIGLQCPGQ